MKVNYISQNDGRTVEFDCQDWRMTLLETITTLLRQSYKIKSIIDDNGREIIIGEPK